MPIGFKKRNGILQNGERIGEVRLCRACSDLFRDRITTGTYRTVEALGATYFGFFRELI